MAFTQDHLACRIDTPLGENALLVQGFEGREAMSELFRFRLRLASERDSIDFESIVGRPVTLTLVLQDGTPRYINGVVARFTQAGAGMRLVYYQAEVVPWFWLLTRKVDCRIFQELTAKEIIQKVFDDGGFHDYDLGQITRSHVTRDYCVQYRESDFQFVSRLMEDEGISYYFTHQDDHHTLVLTDHNEGFRQSPHRSKIEYDLSDSSALDSLHSWERRQDVNTGKYSLNDYNFETPSTDLLSSSPSLFADFNNTALEIYEYPGLFGDSSDGSDRAKLRMEEEEVDAVRVCGRSSFRELCVGDTFELTDHYRNDFNKVHVLTQVAHELRQNLRIEEEEPEEDLAYTNSFECVPDDVTLRPRRTTPTPVVHGLQTAFVVGPSGEELYTEKHGRVKVQFHWDRQGEMDEKSSCWLRVVQGLAGKNWGMSFWPRIGQEVTVQFLDGDPDRPVVTGVLYNAQAMPPYELPGRQTLSGLKSLSSKGGGNFNEIRFEDKAGEEQIFIHAAKNQDVRVKNDQFEEVEHDKHLIVKNNLVSKVENESHATVDQDRFEKVGKDLHLTVVGKQAVEISGSRSTTVKGDVIDVFEAAHSEETAGDLYLKANGVVIQAATGLTLRVGGSTLVLDSAGVTLKGSVVTLDGQQFKFGSGPGSTAVSGSAGNAVSPVAPELPDEADVADPGKVDEMKKQQKSRQEGKYGRVKAVPFKPPADDDEAEERTWIEIELVDEDGNPVPGERYEITLPDGETVARGTLDNNGFARVDGIDPGSCRVTFPNLDQETTKKV